MSSPRANRVTPFGLFEAVPERGRFTGNRGILAPGRQWQHRAWLCCRTAFRGRRVTFDSPRDYTPLFFADEAVALAAGHRPCAECRNPDYRAFKAAFGRAFGLAGPFKAAEMDCALHAARLHAGRQATFEAALGDLPAGTFLTRLEAPRRALLLADDGLRAWSHAGYAPPEPAVAPMRVTVLTPAPTVAVLKAGYRPLMALEPATGA